MTLFTHKLNISFSRNFLLSVDLLSMAQTPPKSFEELIERLNLITGLSISEIADNLKIKLPVSTTRGKGFIGELLEIALGASAKVGVFCFWFERSCFLPCGVSRLIRLTGSIGNTDVKAST